MLQFDGERAFDQPPAALWPQLRDAAFLARSIPDGNGVGEPTRDRATVIVRPGVSFVRGTLDVTIEVVEAREPDSVKLRLVSKGVGSSNTVEATLDLQPQAAGSVVRWRAGVTELTGLLKMAPPGLIRGAAQKVIEDLWTGVAARLRDGTV